MFYFDSVQYVLVSTLQFAGGPECMVRCQYFLLDGNITQLY